jgi:hypothetical protein
LSEPKVGGVRGRLGQQCTGGGVRYEEGGAATGSLVGGGGGRLRS